jgi:hypothetical protein
MPLGIVEDVGVLERFTNKFYCTVGCMVEIVIAVHSGIEICEYLYYLK